MLNLLISLLLLPLGCNNLDIMIVADYSGSVRGNEKFVVNAISSFSNKLDISEDNINMGIVIFNSYSENICNLSGDREYINSRIDLLGTNLAASTTNLSSALYMAFDELFKNGREGYKKVIILISDGVPDNEDESEQIAIQLKQLNVQIYTISIEDGVYNREYMQKIASDQCFFSSDYNNLIKTLDQLNLCL